MPQYYRVCVQLNPAIMDLKVLMVYIFICYEHFLIIPNEQDKENLLQESKKLFSLHADFHCSWNRHSGRQLCIFSLFFSSLSLSPTLLMQTSAQFGTSSNAREFRSQLSR